MKKKTRTQECSLESASNYAKLVASGKIPANKWVKLACKKHLKDISQSNKKNFKYFFCEDSAKKAIKFIQTLPHTKGKWSREKKLLKLEPWQCFFVANVFGWKNKKTGLRKYRRAKLKVPRKNGKSALAAAIGLYMFSADREAGAEVYSGATTERQAKEVFTPAKMMSARSEKFRRYFGVEVRASELVIPHDNSKFCPIIGNPGDGSSPHCAIVDEYHEHPDDRLVDTMQTGMGAREQPLLLVITTAGDNVEGPCFDLELDCQKILDGTINDDTTFSLLYGIDEGDDWTDPETLKKANPNFGISVSEEFLLAQLNQAKNNARKQSTYKTKHLNVWVGSRDAFFNVERWRKNQLKSLKLEDFEGSEIYIGLDLASRVDIAALQILIPDGDQLIQFGKHYLPEQALEKEHYRKWAAEGYLTITDGEIIDFNEIKEDILDLCSRFQVAELAYDPFQATQLITELMGEGVPVVEVRPTVLNFSEPMKELDSMIRSGKLKHNGCPVMTWMISNVTAKADKKDNVYPNKDREQNKIDGPVALMMALSRYLNQEQAEAVSCWENENFTYTG